MKLVNPTKYFALLFFGIALTCFHLTVPAQTTFNLLTGQTDSDSHWGSGWLDLDVPTDFKKGDILRLAIGGTAKKIKIRLLPKGKSSDSTVGMINGSITVPKNRVVELVIQANRKKIVQISVHGGQNPWNKYPLGGDNGPATLDSVALSGN